MSVLGEVRGACRAVAERATYVRIDQERLSGYAHSLPLERARAPEHDPDHHYLGHGADTVAFFVTLDAINFGSGYFPYLKKRHGLSGYFTVATSLTEHFRSNGPIPAERLAELSATDCAGIFGQDLERGPVRELMGLFATALNELGTYLLLRFDGSSVALVESAGGWAERLVRQLAEMPFFEDVEPYGEIRVPFYKRAQLTCADLSLAFGGRGWGRFEDLDELTIFADNLVPHVLRVDGLLRYDPDLAARIDREEPIPAGSPGEVEIRACALHAVELLVEELRRAGHRVSAMELDHVLWNRGQATEYKRDRPRHRTRTVYY